MEFCSEQALFIHSLNEKECQCKRTKYVTGNATQYISINIKHNICVNTTQYINLKITQYISVNTIQNTYVTIKQYISVNITQYVSVIITQSISKQATLRQKG